MSELKAGLPADNAVRAVKFLDEQNICDPVLTAEAFDRMLKVLPHYLRPVLRCAFYTACGKGKSWGWVDLKAGFMRLRAAYTKTDVRRISSLGLMRMISPVGNVA